jgi:hypothetical protein
LQAAGTVSSGELLQAQPSEQPGEHLNWKKKVRAAGDASVAIERESATRYDHMHVRMSGSPAMQHRSDADMGPEVFRVGRDREKGVGCCP